MSKGGGEGDAKDLDTVGWKGDTHCTMKYLVHLVAAVQWKVADVLTETMVLEKLVGKMQNIGDALSLPAKS